MTPSSPKSSSKCIWSPANPGYTLMDQYRRHVNKAFDAHLSTTHDLQEWSVANSHQFWIDLYSYLNIIPPLAPNVKSAYDESLPMSSVPRFFNDCAISYPENVLENRNLDAIALIGLREGADLDGQQVTWRELREMVRVTRSALTRSGVSQGDVVAALVSNSIHAVMLFLASASIGAVFTSISPDLGLEGCISRLRQVAPKIFFADTDATYKGRQTSIINKVQMILDRTESQPQVYLIPISTPPSIFPSIEEFLARASASDELAYNRVPFSHPLFICYSSGTTGPPKCIAHQHGLILNLKKVSMLHNSLGPKDVVMQYSSTSWVMFQIMMGHLSTGATTICYEGSPLWPDARTLMKILDKHKYLFELEKAKVSPKDEYDLSSLRMVNTTGATLTLEQYNWFYQHFPSIVHLSNSAGGTDVATSLVVSDPAGPLRVGEMQVFALGIDVDIVDPETGDSIRDTGLPGEMIVRKPFPSMPSCFWGDKDNKIYRAAYFERFDNIDVWAQHDWLSFNPKTKGSAMHGRRYGHLKSNCHYRIANYVSDGVLNPSGIRFGSGEIYNITESPRFSKEISETLCVGRRRPQDTDESVFLFVKMNSGESLTENLIQRLRDAIRSELSSRHVPKFIIEVDEIPVTINGKKIEIAVKQIISGKDVKASSTVANPDSLKGYKRFVDVELTPKSKL